jgi:hypothetical protein
LIPSDVKGFLGRKAGAMWRTLVFRTNMSIFSDAHSKKF